jgi:hypothetical protein
LKIFHFLLKILNEKKQPFIDHLKRSKVQKDEFDDDENRMIKMMTIKNFLLRKICRKR